jgi:two-component system KDP operon response regulator KdpE
MAEKQNLRILVVDDEKAIRSFLRASLSSQGYNVFESTTGEEALEKSVSSHPDAIILDLGLPDMDGIAVLKEIRKRLKLPIIILSVREEAADKVAALDAGADDYLTKPFSTRELLARIRAVMRRLLPSNKEEVLRLGELSIDIPNHQVKVNGKEADLTPTEYDILKLLILNAGKVLTHRQILQEVWNKADDLEGVLHLLRVTISNLRSKIEPNPDRPTHILTESGIGYRFRLDN